MSHWTTAAGLDLVGRRDELAELDALLDRGASLVTLLGPGGAGKTRLASVWAASRRPAVRIVELAAQQDVAGLVHAVAVAVGYDAPAGPALDPGIERVGQLLAGTTLVLDNLEQIAGAAAVVQRWCSSGARIVATSRTSLDVAGEHVLPVGPLQVDDAVALFERRASRVLPSYEADRHAVTALVRSVDALPFAIELASSRVGMLSPQQILARLAALGGPAQLDRHRSVQACIAWSWELLEPHLREALATLSLFQKPFTLEEAEALVGDGALGAVEQLWSASLLVRYGGDPVRFSPYVLVRSFARAHATSEATRTWLDHVIGAATGAGRQDLEALRPDLWEALHHELATPHDRASIRAATRELQRHASETWLPWFDGHERDVVEVPRALDAASSAALARLLHICGRLEGSAATLEGALERLAPPDDEHRAWLLTERGHLHIRTGHLEPARADLAVAVRHLEGARLATALELLGDAHRMLGDLDGAEAYQRQALSLHVESEDRVGQTSCWSHLAHLAGLRGDREAAHAAYTHAEQLARTPEVRAGLRVNRINFEASSGDPVLALSWIPEALAYCEEARSDSLKAHVLAMGALASVTAGEDPETCLERVDEALALLLKTGQDRSATSMRLTRAAALAIAGRLEQAELALDTAIEASDRAGIPRPSVADAWRVLLALLRGQVEAAAAVILGGGDPAVETLAEVARSGSRAELVEQIEGLERLGRVASQRITARLARGLSSSRHHLRVAGDGTWFELDGRRVDLKRRGPAKAVLLQMARAGGEILAADTLIEAGWPDERILPDAARMRLHTTVRTLRRLGLDDAIETLHGGYRLSPAIDVAVLAGRDDPPAPGL